MWFFPFLGVVAEVVAVFSGRRLWGYRTLTFALLAFTALSMSVWAHHMFTTGQSANKYFALTSTLLLVPAGIEYLGLGATMWRGSIRLTTPMLFALAFAIQFLIGGLTGIMLGAPALDYQLHDSYFVVAHFHYTAFGGALFGAFAAAYYWFPKMTGLVLRDGLGKLHFWLMVLGFNLTFFPQFLAGWAGMPRRVADYPATGLLEGANMASTIGGFVLTVAVLIFIANVILSLMDRVPGRRPTRGAASRSSGRRRSPPPPLNFHGPLPPITSETPVLDRRIGPPGRGGETVSAGWSYVALWGVLLAILAVLHFAFDLSGAAVRAGDRGRGGRARRWAALLAARPPREGVRLLPENSYATVMLAVGAVMVALGLVFGQWLYLIGRRRRACSGPAAIAREYLASRQERGMRLRALALVAGLAALEAAILLPGRLDRGPRRLARAGRRGRRAPAGARAPARRRPAPAVARPPPARRRRAAAQPPRVAGRAVAAWAAFIAAHWAALLVAGTQHHLTGLGHLGPARDAAGRRGAVLAAGARPRAGRCPRLRGPAASLYLFLADARRRPHRRLADGPGRDGAPWGSCSRRCCPAGHRRRGGLVELDPARGAARPGGRGGAVRRPLILAAALGACLLPSPPRPDGRGRPPGAATRRHAGPDASSSRAARPATARTRAGTDRAPDLHGVGRAVGRLLPPHRAHAAGGAGRAAAAQQSALLRGGRDPGAGRLRRLARRARRSRRSTRPPAT